MSDFTRHLLRAADALPDAASIAALYEEIRRLARSLMRRERPNHTLPPTALANEAYLRMFGAQMPEFGSTSEFLAATVTTLRRLLVEHGRRRMRLKRGGQQRQAEIDPDLLASPAIDDRLLALDEAIERLQAMDPGKARLVELRFFGGLSVDEAAEVLGMSPRTAAREWRLARAFLRAEVGGEETDE